MYLTLLTLLTFPFLTLSDSDYPSCSSNSRDPTWKALNTHYNSTQYWTTPAHGFGSGQVSFSLSSNVRPFVASCEATSSQLLTFFDGHEWYPCDMPDWAIPSDQAWFKFNSVGGKLEINQTWTCWEDEGPTLVRYMAYGFGNATRLCKTNTTTYPNWTETGSLYQTIATDCRPVNLEIEASEVTAVA